MIPFHVEPEVCPVTYSCEMLSNQGIDLCTIVDASSVASFDSKTGNYEFVSTDYEGIPEGLYEIKISGQI